MEKPSGAFFEELGQYVYGYKDRENGSWKYVGKGTGDRCWAHIQDKGYSADDCVIIARNLERFEKRKNNSSFLLESFMINLYLKDTTDLKWLTKSQGKAAMAYWVDTIEEMEELISLS